MKISHKPRIHWQQMVEGVSTIPMFAPYRPIMRELGDAWPTIASLNEIAKKYAPTLQLEFTEAAPSSRRKPAASASLRGYIQLIAAEKIVPMRHESAHDIFNYLTFVLFPETKKRLIEIHHQETLALVAAGINLTPQGGRGRSRVQDLATLFDEGGSIAYGDQLIVFGHGILEQFIVEPRPVRAFCWNASLPPHVEINTTSLDLALAEELQNIDCLTQPSRFSGQWIPESLTRG